MWLQNLKNMKLLSIFGIKKEYQGLGSESVRWPLSSFRKPDQGRPIAWNNWFGKQNNWTKQFGKLWSLSLRSLW